jgi:aryl-alcohol dehydrogenase-like predicted oxidoreductase
MTPVYSRLILGTVQFGLEYGIANRTGRPTYPQILQIVREAYEGGVRTFDTAAAYGESERMLGRALHDLDLKEKVTVITKILPLPSELPDAEASHRIGQSVANSLANLGLERLPLVLFHRQENLAHLDPLLAWRAKGVIGEVGVSITDPAGAGRALEIPELSAWQIPSNLLDRRFTDGGWAAQARKRGVVLFARSIYLQGLLLMNDEATPAGLREVITPRRGLREIAASFDLTLAEFALRAMLGRPEFHSVVLGIETLAQLRENLALVQKGPLPAEAMAALDSFQPSTSEFLVNPPAWPSLCST